MKLKFPLHPVWRTCLLTVGFFMGVSANAADDVLITANIPFATVTTYQGQRVDLTLDVYNPPGATGAAPRPAILWIHGGGFRTGTDKKQNYIVQYATEFARRGYVGIAIDYRLRTGEDMRLPGDTAGRNKRLEVPALVDAVDDATLALQWVHEHARDYGIDAQRLFLIGGSAGGRIGANVAYREWRDGNIAHTTARQGVLAFASLWGGPEDVFRLYEIDSADVPTMIIHGTADKTIGVENSQTLFDRLQAAGVRSQLHLLEGMGHTPIGKTTDGRIQQWIDAFFQAELARVATQAAPK